MKEFFVSLVKHTSASRVQMRTWRLSERRKNPTIQGLFDSAPGNLIDTGISSPSELWTRWVKLRSRPIISPTLSQMFPDQERMYDCETFGLVVYEEPTMSDLRYLTTRGPVYYAQVAAPRALKGRFRRLVLQSLRTDKLSEAQTRRWAVVNGWKAAFEAAEANPTMRAEDIEAKAKAEIARLRKLEGLAD